MWWLVGCKVESGAIEVADEIISHYNIEQVFVTFLLCSFDWYNRDHSNKVKRLALKGPTDWPTTGLHLEGGMRRTVKQNRIYRNKELKSNSYHANTVAKS